MKKKVVSLLMAMTLAMSMCLMGCGGDKAASDSSSASSGGSASGDGTIKIGYVQDLTGDYSAAGILKEHGAQVAVKQINENGGVKVGDKTMKLELVEYDSASDTSKSEEGAKKLYLQDKVNVLMGGYSSPSHVALTQIAQDNSQIYFYNQVYEGGVANRAFFDPALGEDLQLDTLMQYMIENFGKKVYCLYADYNWGQISDQWVEYYTKKYGGEMVGSVGKPFGTTEYSDVIADIQKVQPDVIITEIAGSAMNAFFNQYQSAGLDIPMGCTINLLNGEHISLSAPTLKNMYVTVNYAEEIDTPENKAFKEYWRSVYPDEAYIGGDAFAEYCGIYMYKLAVEDAKTTDVAAVTQSLEKELVFDSPVGPIYIDGATHHGVLKQYLIKCDENHKLTVLKEFDPIKPSWMQEYFGVDLRKSDPKAIYTPADIK